MGEGDERVPVVGPPTAFATARMMSGVQCLYVVGGPRALIDYHGPALVSQLGDAVRDAMEQHEGAVFQQHDVWRLEVSLRRLPPDEAER